VTIVIPFGEIASGGVGAPIVFRHLSGVA